MTADGEGEKSKFRWLYAARYAIAAAVTVLIMAVIIKAVKVVLRPDSLQLSVDKASISTTTTQSPPPQLEQALVMELKLRAQNPSGRVRMYYVGVFGYLFDNITSASASLQPDYDCIAYLRAKDMTVVQLEAVDNSLRLTVKRKQMDPSYFDKLYNGSSIPDMTLRLDGDLITEVTSELNMTRRTTYYCEDLLVGGGDDEASKYRQDAICKQRRALN